MVDFLAAGLLGRHEVGRADDEAAGGHVGVGEPRHAEVEDLQAAVVLDEDVPGLDVAVEDAVHVRDGEALAHLAHHVEARLERERLGALQVVVERVALEQLHHHVEPPLVLSHVVHGDEVAVLQLPGDLGLAVEALARLAVALEVGHHDLERDVAVVGVVEGAVDDAHRALADAIGDAVAADGGRAACAAAALLAGGIDPPVPRAHASPS